MAGSKGAGSSKGAASKKSGFRVKRVYDEPSADDGMRVLVDRLWPRGLKKENARLDLWAKDVTPSGELRKWFHDAPDAHHDEFAARYTEELDGDAQQKQLEELRAHAAKQVVTLLTANKDAEHSHVQVLLQQLEG